MQGVCGFGYWPYARPRAERAPLVPITKVWAAASLHDREAGMYRDIPHAERPAGGGCAIHDDKSSI